nr:hypothetical protein [Paraburkholderia sp. BL8N3]
MAQTLDLRVVHGMLTRHVRVGKLAARDEVHGNRELAFGGIKVDTLYVPRGHDSKGGFKQLVRQCSFRLHGGLQHSAATATTQLIESVRLKGSLRRDYARPRPANHPLRIQKRHIGLRQFDGNASFVPRIRCEIAPPADILVAKCSLVEDQLTVTIVAHPNFDTSALHLAVRAVPGNFMLGRRQISDVLEWTDEDGLRKGTARVHLPESDQVLLMLMIGNVTVRRTWILDPTKARNNRLLAIQHFDRDLKKLSEALWTADSRIFEKGIASLLSRSALHRFRLLIPMDRI